MNTGNEAGRAGLSSRKMLESARGGGEGERQHWALKGYVKGKSQDKPMLLTIWFRDLGDL